MAPLSADKSRQSLGSPGFIQALPVKAGEKIFGNALVLVDSNGLAVEAGDTVGLKCAGVAETGYDNTDGANGTLTPPAARYCRVQRGCWSFAVAGSPKALARVYVVDDDHLTTVSGNVPGGICIEPNPDVAGEWFVYVPGYDLGLVLTTGTDPTDLTENSTTIGGSNDGDIPDLTATAATVTGTLTGTTDGALADVAAIAISTSGGNTYADSAVNTAVNTAITSINLQLKELQVALNKVIADNVALRAGVREVADKTNDLMAGARDAGVIA